MKLNIKIYLALTLCCFGIYMPMLFLDGWPYNHEYLSMFERVEIFKISFENSNFFPLWTPFAQGGYGSPFPFFYHRLYNTVAGLLSWITDSTYWSVKISIPLLSSMGAIGMYQCTLEINSSKKYAFISALLLITSNYSMTDWFVRGAFAEYTAFMLIPWLICFCLQCIDKRNKFPKITAILMSLTLSLIFYAHSIIFYYAAFLILILIFIRFSHIKQILLSTFLTFVFTFPYIYLIISNKGEFNFGNLLTESLRVENNFKSLGRYIIDTEFNWGGTWNSYSVEIGRTITITLLCLVILISLVKIMLIFKSQKKIMTFNFSSHENEIQKKAIFISVSLLFFILLQTKGSIWFYELVPYSEYIQFPWRLLSYITVFIILALIFVIDNFNFAIRNSSMFKIFYFSKQCKIVLLLIILLVQLLFYLNTQFFSYEKFTKTGINDSLKVQNLATSLVFGGEYLLKGYTYPSTKPKSLISIRQNCESLKVYPRESLSKIIYFDEITIDKKLDQVCILELNQFNSPFIRIKSQNEQSVQTYTSKTGSVIIKMRENSDKLIIKVAKIGDLIHKKIN